MNCDKFLSVIIPAYNEERRILLYLSEIIEYLGTQEYPGEIIVVDDGSTDGTSELVEQLSRANSQVRLIRLPTS
jgi:glycosyltransferase involved in cell wall biosynthesis